MLVVDEANSVSVNIANERYQIERFLRQNEGHLAQPTTLMVYSDQGVQAQPRPTKDGKALAETFDKLSMSTHMIPLAGGYDAIERLDRSLKALQLVAAVEARKPGKKMLIWIGPGWPMLQGPAYQQSESSQRSGFNTVVEITRLLREARITLYNINAFDPGSAQGVRTDFYKSFLKPARSSHEMETGDLAVPVFAVHTGGSVFRTGGDVAALLNRCIRKQRRITR